MGGAGACGVPDEVDWQGEHRWYDRPWVPVGLSVLLVGGMAAVLLRVGLGGAGAVGGVAGAVGGIVGGVWAGARVRREITRETGLSRQQLPVVARRLRKEHLPADRRVQRAMDLLASRQLRQLRQGRRTFPLLFGLYVLLGADMLTSGNTAFGLFWLLLAAFMLVAVASRRRTLARLVRVRARLAATTGPPTGRAECPPSDSA